jgi:Type IV secretion system proteins
MKIKTVLLAGIAAGALFLPGPATAQMSVIDVKSIDQLVDQLKVLQQQLQQAEQIYQETIGVYNQTVSIVNSVSGLTNVAGLAPALNGIGLQNPIQTTSASMPPYIGGITSPASLPFGSTYLTQNTYGTLPTGADFISTQIRQAVQAISAHQAYANQNLQVLESRIAALPQIVSAIGSATTVQQVSALQARLTGEQNYATLQTAQAANLKTTLAGEEKALEITQLQFEYQQETLGIQASCAALQATAVAINPSSCAGSTAGTTAPATPAAAPVVASATGD